MFDDKKEKVIHQLTVPDNTFGIFCHYDKQNRTVEIFVGDFASEDIQGEDSHQMLLDIGESITLMLEATIQNAISQAVDNNNIELKPVNRGKHRDGNIVYANFSKGIH